MKKRLVFQSKSGSTLMVAVDIGDKAAHLDCYRQQCDVDGVRYWCPAAAHHVWVIDELAIAVAEGRVEVPDEPQ